MSSAPFLPLLPSRRTDALRAAIGRTLVGMSRLLTRPPEDFGRACGSVELQFDGGIVHTLGVLASELSVIVLEEPLRPDYAAEVYTVPPGDPLQACLGRRCEDVRIWIYADGVPSDEAREAAVSYVLSGGLELFYAIYLHGDLDADYLLLGDEVPRGAVARWFGVRDGGR